MNCYNALNMLSYKNRKENEFASWNSYIFWYKSFLNLNKLKKAKIRFILAGGKE